jgi:hypothetical protein
MGFKKNSYSSQEIKIFKRLDRPAKIQDFLNALKFNFETQGDTCQSPRRVLKSRRAHCMEGALFAAAVLEFHGHKPLVMDLKAASHDFDHVVALFKKDGFWGALSKTNHAVLRYREPIYKTLRELAMSYFHEYFDNKGRKNLRKFSEPLNLSRFDYLEWRTAAGELFGIPANLDDTKHYSLLNSKQARSLRKADTVEILAGKIIEYKKPR